MATANPRTAAADRPAPGQATGGLPATDGVLYHGTVLHRRLRPKAHRLAYRVFSLLTDLDALPDLDRRLRLFSYNRFNLFSLYDKDHGPGDGTPLRAQIDAALARAGIDLAGGPVRLLAYPRVLGYVFNPLSVFYCHHADGRLVAVVHEVSNTFGQRHSYVVPVPEPAPVIRQSCPKVFHVSPFMEMECTYHFRLVPPGEKVAVAIQQDGPQGTILHASFVGTGEAISDKALVRAFLRYPLMTWKVIGGIHWEALLLWRKGLRLRPDPGPPPEAVTIHGPAGVSAASTPPSGHGHDAEGAGDSDPNRAGVRSSP